MTSKQLTAYERFYIERFKQGGYFFTTLLNTKTNKRVTAVLYGVERTFQINKHTGEVEMIYD